MIKLSNNQSPNLSKLPDVAMEIVRRLRGLGLSVGDERDLFMSKDAPSDAAAYVTSEDADSSGIVKIIRFNPNVVQEIIGNLNMGRLKQLDNYTKELVKKEKDGNVSGEQARAAAEELLRSITEKDGDFLEDVIRYGLASKFFAETIPHERAHQRGQQQSSEGMFSEFKGEGEAEAAEHEGTRIVDKALSADLPEVILNLPGFRDTLKQSSSNVFDNYYAAKVLLKMAEHMDSKGRFDVSDQIESLVAELIK